MTDQAPQVALCLSGGGFRAALFHLGALRRLNELGVLSNLAAISSVSGGSILNGILCASWSRLTPAPDNRLGGFDEFLAEPLRDFCARDLRTPLLVGTRLNPFKILSIGCKWFSISGNLLAEAYESLFKGKRLMDSPEASKHPVPRFIFCATSMNTGACWHFHAGENGRMGDFYIGYLPTGDLRISEAVAASSAFPLAIAPLSLRIAKNVKPSRLDQWGKERPISEKRKPAFGKGDKTISLTDGGVYDNLGVEPVWGRFENLLVSDAGRPFSSLASCSPFVVSRLARAAAISGEQVGAVRKRWMIERFEKRLAAGAFWGIDTRIENYGLSDAKALGPKSRDLLPQIRTDLNAFTQGEMDCIENHGYSLADAAMRSHGRRFCPNPDAPFDWPRKEMCSDAVVAEALATSGKISLKEDLLALIEGRRGR